MVPIHYSERINNLYLTCAGRYSESNLLGEYIGPVGFSLLFGKKPARMGRFFATARLCCNAFIAAFNGMGVSRAENDGQTWLPTL